MAWLVVCPYHKTGVFGLIFFFFILFHQPTLHGLGAQSKFLARPTPVYQLLGAKSRVYVPNQTPVEINLFYQIFFFFFLMCALYTSSFLPYGKYYNRLGGNIGMLAAYFYVFFYLTFPAFRHGPSREFFSFDFTYEVRGIS